MLVRRPVVVDVDLLPIPESSIIPTEP